MKTTDRMTNWGACGVAAFEPFTPEELARLVGAIELSFAFSCLARLTRRASLKRWAQS